MASNQRLRKYQFNTGIYSRMSYKIFDALLRNDYLTSFPPKIFGQTRPIRDFSNYYLECFGGIDLPFLQWNFINVSPTGEILIKSEAREYDKIPETFNITTRRVVKALNKLKTETTLSLWIDGLLDVSEEEKQNVNDGIDFIIKHLRKKLTAKDLKSPLYEKYIGHQMNPFETEAAKIDKENLNELLKMYNDEEMAFKLKNLEIPEKFEPDLNIEGSFLQRKRRNDWIVYTVYQAYEKYLSHLA